MWQRAWNRADFEDAYRDLSPRAHAIATRVMRDSSAAEDVVQEVFAELWRRPQAFDPERGSLSAYVSMLARCRALDRLRSLATLEAAEKTASESDPPAGEPESAADPVLRRERSRTMLHALRELPDEQREAVLLTYGLGMTTSEVARAVHVPIGTAKSRVRLGLLKARTALEQAA
jgi:RNA polymerase sigma-70 factor (ECF subfamily)